MSIHPPFSENLNELRRFVDLFKDADRLMGIHQFRDAAAQYEKAIELSKYVPPRSSDAVLNNYSIALYKSCRYEESEKIIINLLRSTSRNSNLTPNLRNTLGTLQMVSGNYQDGLKNLLFYKGHASADGRSFHDCARIWDGEENLHGKNILLISDGEYGIGDYISGIRFAQTIKSMGANVSIELSKAFIGLDIGDIEIVDYPIQPNKLAKKYDLIAFQHGSLPKLLNISLDNLPTKPYIFTKKNCINRWSNLLGKMDIFRVGLCWSGSNNRIDEERFFPFNLLIPLLDLDIEFHSLQIEYRDLDLFILNNSKIINHAPNLHNLNETASLISQMDLIISVDTSVAHLAGAMGHPLWVMLPNYKNYYWNGEKPHWYPHAKTFRQAREGDWSDVVEQVKSALAKMVVISGKKATI